MTDSASTSTQADDVQQSQADTSQIDQQQGDTQAESHDTANLDDLKKVRSEAASLRKRLKDAESRLAEFENTGKSEAEKFSSERDAALQRAETAERELREYRAKDDLRAAVSKLSTVPDANAIVDLALPLLTYNDDGKPDNIEEAMDQVKAKYPRLFPAAAGSGDGGKGGSAANSFSMNDALRAIAPGA